MTHKLKCWPAFFAALKSGVKTFEMRQNDRNYQVGDTLELHEWSDAAEEFTTAPPLKFRVTHILHGPLFGLEAGWCIMSIQRL